MKLTLIAISFFLLLATFTNNARALKSSEFIDYLGNKIYNDCKEADINIRDIYDANDQPVTILKWPYEVTAIKRILQIFAENEPFPTIYWKNKSEFFFLGSRSNPPVALLRCKDAEHKLDISGDVYYWAGMKVELPTQINVSANSGGQANVFGDNVQLNGNAKYMKKESSPLIINIKLIFESLFKLGISLALISLAYSFIIKLIRRKKNKSKPH